MMEKSCSRLDCSFQDMERLISEAMSRLRFMVKGDRPESLFQLGDGSECWRRERLTSVLSSYSGGVTDWQTDRSKWLDLRSQQGVDSC